MEYHVFLSYSRRDTDIMQSVRDTLCAGNLSVWTDEGIETGTRSWRKTIEETILNAGCLICILSPDANQSQWVRAEIEFAELHNKPIYLILARGDKRRSVPFGFTSMQWVDIRDLNTIQIEQQLQELIDIIRKRSGKAHDTSEPTTSETESQTAYTPAPNSPSTPKHLISLVPHINLTDEMQNALSVIKDQDTSPTERARAGNTLNAAQDPRRGVGIRMDHIPDIDWVKIPIGRFTYQYNENQKLPTFYISRYPITYQQFQQFVDDPQGYSQDKWWRGLAVRQKEPGQQIFKFQNRPRESVSWYDAVAFTRWLSALLNYEIRLPTDKEWEKAARGPHGRLYPWGDHYLTGYANINGTAKNTETPVLFETSAVGIYPHAASTYGVLDLAGNVWEWCLNPYDHPDEINMEYTGQRILRGGSWYNSHEAIKTTYRNAGDADGRTALVGFRVAHS